jgi:hypothetical protein
LICYDIVIYKNESRWYDYNDLRILTYEYEDSVFIIRRIVFYSIFANRFVNLVIYIPSKKKKSEVIDSLLIVLAFILFFMALLVDIRN